jgi:hypothetical protein
VEELGRLSWARVFAVLAATVALTALVPGLTSAASRRPVASTPRAAHATAADQVAPNDPGFAGCETQDPITGCTHNEQWDLFGPLTGNTCPAPGNPALVNPHPDGGLPCWALNATDPQHSSGVNMTGAWQQGNLGRPDVLIAYIEGGVNYDSDSIKDGLDSVFLNRGELPYPEDMNGQDHGTYDLNGDGRFDIRDWAQDPRVNPPCPPGVAAFVNHAEGVTWSCVPGGQHQYLNSVHVGGVLTPYLSPEDLIAVFGDCRIVDHRVKFCRAGHPYDNDGNGYPNDISGWNFYRNNNDPQTEDHNYSHAPSLISALGGEANNNFAGVGECRECMVVPIKQGAEPLGLSDRWGESILYATDLGASAISSVVVEYSFSSFSQEAIDYAYNHGVVLSLDSNDFDSMDHTDGMLFNHVIPGNSLTLNQSPNTQWFRARSNVTSYGTHNIFSGEGNSTSAGTPFLAATMAMVQSAGLDARDRGIIPDRLTPDEVKQVLMNTASPVVPQLQAPGVANQWPGNPGSVTDATHTNWSTQYGYGRPDVGAATGLVLSGQVPPTAEIDSPSWYQYVDPARQHALNIGGSLAPPRWRAAGPVQWVLEWALGADPSDSDFQTISQGVTSHPITGTLGTMDLSQIPPSYYDHAPTSTLPPDGPEQYTVTLRLRVVGSNGLKAEDRRSIGVRHDPTLLPGFPKQVGGEVVSEPSYVDLEGRHQLDLVYATTDGEVNALRPDGSQVPGFPVYANFDRQIDPNNPENFPARAYRTVPALRDVRDPVVGMAVGDLFGNGTLDIVATTSNADVYAWNANGQRLSGFPVSSDPQFWTLPVPTPAAPTLHGRLPARGDFAPPVLASLEGGHQLDILMSAFDGHVYAWRPDGTPVPGWPVNIQLRASDFARLGVNPTGYIRDSKLMYAVGVGDVLGTGHPQVFVSSFECDNSHPAAFLYGLWGDGNNHAGGAYLPGWPVRLPSFEACYDQSIDFVEEGTSPPVIGNFGAGYPQVISSPVTGPVDVINGDGTIARSLSIACSSAACAPNPPYRPTGDALTFTLTGQGGLGDLLNTGTPQFLQSSVGAESISKALGDTGHAAVPQVYEKAWDVGTGAVLPNFPVRQDGFPFYDAPLSADVAGDGTRQVIEGNDNYWIHAWDVNGGEAPGWPKYTDQWTSFSGVVGDPTMNGQLRYATGTREGSLFVWQVAGDARLDNSWSHYRGNDYNSGLYGQDSRRPEAILDLRRARRVLAWTAPGGDYELGQAAAYQVLACRDAECIDADQLAGPPTPAVAGVVQSYQLPPLPHGTRYLALRAVNAAGNLSALGNVVRAR